MPDHNLQEPLKTFPPVLDYIVAEAVGEDFAWERWNCYLPFCQITLDKRIPYAAEGPVA